MTEINLEQSAGSNDLTHCCGDISQSIAFQDTQMKVESPVYKVNIVGFKSLPRYTSRDFSQTDTMSIEDDSNNYNMNRHPKLYKCYKCYGCRETLNYKMNQPKCRQCSGSQYITQSHPLVSIMEDLIKKKIPDLIKKADQIKKTYNRRETLEVQYGCKDAIKQESFSYMQQQTPICKNCGQQCDASIYRSCQKCQDYNICQSCFQQKRYTHHHYLFLKDQNKPTNSLFVNSPTNMRKISEQMQCLEMSNYLDDIDLKCSNCQQIIENCYQYCVRCERRGIIYVICGQCSKQDSYIHDKSHQFQMKTIPHTSQLIHLNSRPEYSQKTDMSFQFNLHSQDMERSCEHSMNHNNTYRSIIQINHDISQSCDDTHIHEIQQDFLNNMDVEISNNARNSVHFNVEQIDQKQPILSHKLSQTYHNDGNFQKIQIQDRFNHQKQQNLRQMSFSDIDLEQSIKLNIITTQNNHLIPNNSEFDQFSPTIPFSPTITAISQKPKSKVKYNPEDQYIFNDYQCDICSVIPIKNKRFHCQECENYDICQNCYLVRSKKHEHRNFQEIDGLKLLKKQRQSLIKISQIKQSMRVSSKKPAIDLRRTCQ